MPSGLRFGNWIAASWDKSSRGRHILLGIQEWIYRGRSPYQEVVLARVPEFGRGLFLDGVVQFLELDEFIYHEHLALLPLLYHPHPRRVLILGGGDGLALREVLRDPRVERAVLVDLDGLVVEACREHLPDLHRGSFDDPRSEIVIGDARDYLASGPEPFDVVIVDLVDPYGPEGMALYEEVLGQTRTVLAEGAVVSTHGEAADHPYFLALRVFALLKGRFRHVELHRAYVTSFSGEWGFLLASDDVDFRGVPSEALEARAARVAGTIRSFLPRAYPAAFDLPPFLADPLARLLAGTPLAPVDHVPEAQWLEAGPEG